MCNAGFYGSVEGVCDRSSGKAALVVMVLSIVLVNGSRVEVPDVQARKFYICDGDK